MTLTEREKPLRNLPSTSRYKLLVRIAAGGMATVYVGRLTAAEGFSRLVAIKRAHPHLLEDPVLCKSLSAEARIVSSIHHPNVVSVQDVEELEGELLLVMDYVEGASLADLVRQGELEEAVPARIIVRIVLDACAGLHAAHQATDEDGHPLGIVHRDVSPHNILVGLDGLARITDFGIAKGASGQNSTATGQLKGKFGYMAPEYVRGQPIDARSDVFAMAVVLWEAIAGRRLFRADNEADTLQRVLRSPAPPLSRVADGIDRTLDATVAKALSKEPEERHPSARAFADALEEVSRSADLIATHAEVGAFVASIAGDVIAERREAIRVRARHGPRDAVDATDATDATPTAGPPSSREARTGPRESTTPDTPASGTSSTPGAVKGSRAGRLALGLVAAAVLAYGALRWRQSVGLANDEAVLQPSAVDPQHLSHPSGNEQAEEAARVPAPEGADPTAAVDASSSAPAVLPAPNGSAADPAPTTPAVGRPGGRETARGPVLPAPGLPRPKAPPAGSKPEEPRSGTRLDAPPNPYRKP